MSTSKPCDTKFIGTMPITFVGGVPFCPDCGHALEDHEGVAASVEPNTVTERIAELERQTHDSES